LPSAEQEFSALDNDRNARTDHRCLQVCRAVALAVPKFGTVRKRRA
jgi:hypothetical protein